MGGRLWTIYKDTKNESNSQLSPLLHLRSNAVNYIQRYKKWKQFTTATVRGTATAALWTIYKDTKNESNSQHHHCFSYSTFCCELYTKIQKMKAIHNRVSTIVFSDAAVNYIQRYKKWKQFTTMLDNTYDFKKLWTIYKDTKNESNSQRGRGRWLIPVCCELYTKIQKMKAIHNSFSPGFSSCIAVNYIQRYKKWKQFTTLGIAYRKK